MARTMKQGLEYFPLDIHLDDKFKFIEIKYGIEGFGIIVRLIQKIYSCGYWYKWESDEQLIFAYENNINNDLLLKVVNEAIDRGIFDKEKYEDFTILTSKGIQKRYQQIVSRRKGVELVPDYLLIDGSFGTECKVSSNNDSIMLTGCKQDVDIVEADSKQEDNKNGQSKGKERKVKESKKDKEQYSEFVKKVLKEYPGRKTKAIRDKKLPKLIKEHSEDELLRCIKRYAKSVKGNEIQYIMHEGTFWNGRYLDFIDSNYKESSKGKERQGPLGVSISDSSNLGQRRADM